MSKDSRAVGKATHAEGNLGGEEGDALVGVEGRVNEGALDDVFVTTDGLEEGVGEDGSG